MPTITWNGVGERLYHTGVDRGVLYTLDNPGVPWNGLVNVTAKPVYGDPQSFYLDGQKVQNIPGNEDFGATIEAFAAPLEFAPCAGRLHMSTGLFAGDQPKQTFGFAYRTLIGNDVDGQNFAYQIHIVYGATAQLSNFTHETNDSSPTASTYSWTITTVPIDIAGFRSTAHFIFDSRINDDATMGAIERILYGSDSEDPRLPTADELLDPLGDVVWWDLTGLSDFPDDAVSGDAGVDFDTDDLYAMDEENPYAYWYDLTGGADFPTDAVVSDWGYDTVTGDVYKKTA
jgi:hypothetical protein